MRVLRSVVWALLGLALIAAAFFIPSHLRALDSSVLARSGAGTPGLADAGLGLLTLEKLGPARMFARAAERLQTSERERLDAAVRQFATANPEMVPWGGADPYLPRLITAPAAGQSIDGLAVMDLILPRTARQALLEFLQTSRRPGVHELLRNRELTTTTVFPPVPSASGQPLEAAILLTALLSQGDYLMPSLREAIEASAALANRGGDVRWIESIYANLVSLGRRLNWRQLTEWVRGIDSTATFHDLAGMVRESGERLPILFAAVHFADSPRDLVSYLKRFGETGMDDLEFSVRSGRGAVRELIERQQRVYHPHRRETVARWPAFKPMFASFVDVSRHTPVFAVALKYCFIFLGGVLLAHALLALRTVSTTSNRAPQEPHLIRIPAITLSREVLFAVLLLIFAVAFFEPFLAQDNQTREFPLRWSFPMTAEAIRTTITKSLNPIMDQLTIVSLVLFFSLQSVLYILSLIKLTEIKRQPISCDVKLQLLDNEENLFDAGLYVGLGGTVASLVFIALGIVKPMLMAAYASTLFGLLFVAILKICHLRPYRRELILEKETVRA